MSVIDPDVLRLAQEGIEWCTDFQQGMFTPARTDDGWSVEMHQLVADHAKLCAVLLMTLRVGGDGVVRPTPAMAPEVKPTGGLRVVNVDGWLYRVPPGAAFIEFHSGEGQGAKVYDANGNQLDVEALGMPDDPEPWYRRVPELSLDEHEQRRATSIVDLRALGASGSDARNVGA